MRRSDQRRDAVFALYQHEVTGRPIEELLEGAKPFTEQLAEGVLGNREELDELIARHSKGWALDGVEALLLDLSGVVYVQDEAVPGAAEALSALRERDVPLRLVTNTTMRPRRSILERLDRLRLEAGPEELIPPATLAARRCQEQGYGSVSLVVLDELREDLEGIPEDDDAV